MDSSTFEPSQPGQPQLHAVPGGEILMRALVVDDEAKAKVQGVLDYALDPAHFYRPRKDARVPGDDHHFVVHLNSYRCVFTITEDSAQRLWRHLTISIPSIDYSSP